MKLKREENEKENETNKAAVAKVEYAKGGEVSDGGRYGLEESVSGQVKLCEGWELADLRGERLNVVVGEPQSLKARK